MSRSRTVALLVSVVMLAILAGPVPAGANVITRSDGNDTPGPLDLASVRVSHATGATVFRITTLRRFGNKLVNGNKGQFEVDFDTNADRKANFYAIVFFKNGRMRGWLFKGNGDRITKRLTARRVGRRAVRVTVPLAKIGNPKSYDFAVFSVFFDAPCRGADPCIDSIPNKFPLIRHDLTAPTITWGANSPPTYSSDVSAGLSFHVAFTVKDDKYGSGVKDWTLQRQEVGTGTWVDVKVGTKLTATPNVTGVEQGKTYDLRVIVRDNQGNVTTGEVRPTTVPYDDRNVLFDYTPPWTQLSVAGAFRGTTSASGPGDIVSFAIDGGQQLCIIEGPTESGEATATLKVGAADPVPLTEETAPTTGARDRQCVDGPFSADTLVLITVQTGEFVFDGAAVRP